MAGKDGEKLKKKKAKIKTAKTLAAKNTQVEGNVFIESLNILNKDIDDFKNKKLSKNDAENLMMTYKVSVGNASDYLKNKDLSPELKESVVRLKRSLAKDLQALSAYVKKLEKAADDKPVELYTFNQLLEISRSKRIEVDVDAVQKAGAGQHVRAVIPTDDGKYYFTESEKKDTESNYKKKLLEAYKRKYGADADFLNDKKLRDAVLVIYATKADRIRANSPGMNNPDRIISNYKEAINKEIANLKKGKRKLSVAEDCANALDLADSVVKKKY